MSKYRRWGVLARVGTLASVGALASACQLGLEGRACSVSSSGDADACMEGWSCCADDVCRRECSDGEDDAPSTPDDADDDGASNAMGSDTMGSDTMGSDMMGSSDDTGTAQADAGAPPAGDASPGDASPGDASPSGAARADIGPEGGELVLADASVQIPAGALSAVTTLELSLAELPLALPVAREQTSQVYALSPADTSFAQPVTFVVPVGASPSRHMIVLELGAGGWQPVEGARFEAAPSVDPENPSPGGSVTWATQRAGVFVVAVVSGNESAMALSLGDAPYSYACDGGGGSSVGVGDPNGGVGPSFSTQNTSPNVPECPWPQSEPGLWLDVIFRNFLASEGVPLGTWDLALPETILPLRVRFIASEEEEVPVGQERPYQYYDSTTPVEGAEGPIPEVTYQGFYQSPIAGGRVTVSRLPTVENTGMSFSFGETTNASLYRIELSNVTLGATAEGVSNPEDPFPPTMTISSATLTYAL